jgi:hypothetical protein
MAPSDRAEFNRLILQIERDILAEANLRVLLTEARTVVGGHRRELQTVRARLKRPRTRRRQAAT